MQEIEFVEGCDTVIDCTADDSVIYHLSQFHWEESRLFVSLSLGFQAKRLYCYSIYDKVFPHDSFRESISRWLLKERDEIGDFEFPLRKSFQLNEIPMLPANFVLCVCYVLVSWIVWEVNEYLGWFQSNSITQCSF